MEDLNKGESLVKTIGSKDITQVDEETAEIIAEKSERDARLKALRRYWTYFSPIYNKIKGGMTLDEVQEEVRQKKSNLSAIARTFALTQEKYIRLWIQDLENKEKEDKQN